MRTAEQNRAPKTGAGKIDCVEHITKQLEEDIALGRLKPRERLIEDELMQRFNAKRNVVRQVLFELEKLGMVVRARNKGAFVRHFLPQEVEDIYQVRELLEEKATELISFPVEESVIEKLKKIQQTYVDAKQKGDLSTVFRENMKFHRTFFQICKNPVLTQAIEYYAMKSHSIRSYTILDPERLNQMSNEHFQIIDCLEKNDSGRLKKLVKNHLRPSRKTYIMINKT